MARKKAHKQTAQAIIPDQAPAVPAPKQWLAIGAMITMLAVAVAIFYHTFFSDKKPSKPAASTQANQPASTTQAGASPEANKMNIAQAVMVTQELDFGQPVPSIAQALNEIERGYVPDGGQGRTFAVLEAYG